MQDGEKRPWACRAEAVIRFSAFSYMLAFACALSLAASFFFAGSAFAVDESSQQATAASQSSQDPVPAGDPFEDAVEVDMDDGLYLVDVSLEGGSGRASVESPAEFEVFDGRGVVKLVWSSSHYDYMLVNGKKYLRANNKGNSLFAIPVLAYDTPVPVVGDTTAMGEPHEVDYQITVALASVQAYDEGRLSRDSLNALAGSDTAAKSKGSSPASQASSASEATASQDAQAQSSAASQSGGLTWPWVVFIVCAILSAVVIGITIGLLRSYRS